MADNVGRKKLSPKKQRAVLAMMSNSNIKEAAKQAGVSKRTLERWLADPEFRAALLVAETEAINEATRKLVRIQGAAINAIGAVLLTAEKDNTRLRAASLALDFLIRYRELRNVEERIAALERALLEDHP